jgi:hypothetical protein
MSSPGEKRGWAERKSERKRDSLGAERDRKRERERARKGGGGGPTQVHVHLDMG